MTSLRQLLAATTFYASYNVIHAVSIFIYWFEPISCEYDSAASFRISVREYKIFK